MIFKVMRFVLFYSDVESFNYFTDRIVEELNKKNHECFVLDLRDMSESGEHSFERFNSFLEKKADAAIAFDGLGIKDRIFVELWDSMNPYGSPIKISSNNVKTSKEVYTVLL